MTDQRPQGVSVIAVLHVLEGVGDVFAGLLLLAVQADLSNYLSVFGIRASWASGTVLGAIALLIGILYIAIGWGLWNLQEWARAVALALCGLAVLGALILMAMSLSVPSATAAVLTLIPASINGIIVWYLLQPHVVEAFATVDKDYSRLQGADVQPTVPTPIEPPAPPPPKPTRVPGPAPIMAWLVIQGQTRQGQFGLGSSTAVLGRDASRCDVVLEDDAVSREHAKIRYEGGRFWIYDLGSRNGTFINNHKVQRQMLIDGDRIRVGDTVLVFKEVR